MKFVVNSNDPETFKQFVILSGINSFKQLRDVIISCPEELKKDKELCNLVSASFTAILNNKIKNKSVESLVPLLKNSNGLITEKDQQLINIKILFNVKGLVKKFNKRQYLNYVIPRTILSPELSFDFIKKYAKLLEKDTINKLLQNIPDGDKNKDIQIILNKQNNNIINRLNSLDLTKQKDRNDFIKAIAKNSNLLYKWTGDFEISIADLKALTPSKRINLLNKIYSLKKEIGESISGGRYGRDYTFRRLKKPICKVKLCDMSKDELRSLLFSSLIKNTDEVNELVKLYEEYNCKKDMIHDLAKRINNIM